MNTNINATTATDSTAQEILDKLKTVDGAGSGLDADLVQGKDVYSTISNPNLLINGDFQVWQRGESFTATSKVFNFYTADRWILRYPNGRIEKVLSGLPLFKYAARFTNTGTTNDYNVLHYNMENTAELAGSPLTLSFYIRGTDGKTVITTLGSANYSINITKQWTKHVCSIGSVAFGEHFRRGVAFNTLNQNFAANEYFEIAAVKIELGNTATPYVPRSYGEELALCKRYYEKIDRYDGLFCEMAGMIISNMRFSDKRTVPKISFTDSDGKQRYIDYYPSDGNWLKLKTSDSDARTDAFQFQLLNRSDISAKPAVGHIVARNLEFDAEIY